MNARRRYDLIVGGFCILSASFPAQAQLCAPSWGDPIPGVSAALNVGVNAVRDFAGGSGGASVIVAGGQFETAGGVSVRNIAQWDGQAWAPLGSGTNGWVQAMEVYDDGVGGGPALYVLGAFDTAGGITAKRIARWDGDAWSPVGDGAANAGLPETLVVFEDPSAGGPALYVGGGFDSMGGVSTGQVAKWNGQVWSSVGNLRNHSIRALAVFGSGSGAALYAGGSASGGAGRVLKFDGNSWVTIGTGSQAITCFASWDGGESGSPELYAGGGFETMNSVRVNRVAKWNGVTWSGLSTGLDGVAYSMEVFADGTGLRPSLFVGGTFDTAGGAVVKRIAKWDGQQWSALGSGMAGYENPPPYVLDMVAVEQQPGNSPLLYVVGIFTSAGGISAEHVAVWQGCPLPGACCLSNGACIQASLSDCGSIPDDTSWSGPYSSCTLLGNVPRCPRGACCLPDGSCEDGAEDAACLERGGEPLGPGTRCNSIACPQPLGACCLQFGGCVELLAVDCQEFPGSAWAGPLTTCVNNGGGPICPLGACCLSDGSCVEGLLPSACTAMNGTHRPGGIACAQANCPPPVGACCLANGNCVSVTQSECVLFSGSTWAGALTACVDIGGTPRCPLGACCLPNGTCVEKLLPEDCQIEGGDFRGPGATCANANCPQPTGVCCLANGNCVILTNVNCAASPGSRWAGPSTTCADANSNGTADACERIPGDINGDGVANPADIPPFVAVLLGMPQAPEHVGRSDLNADGVVNAKDVQPFVAAVGGP